MAAKAKEVKKAVKSTRAKSDGVVVASITKSGAKGKVSLNKDVFGQEPNKILLAQVTRVILANKRKAHAKTKGRGEVSRSTAKISRQKGTGHARHGSRSAPIFVGGGIAHGPRGIENYHLRLPQKMRQAALVSALSARAKAGNLFVADVESLEPKTKTLASLLQKNNLAWGATFVYRNSNFSRVVRNIEGVRSVRAQDLTAYDVLTGKFLVLTREAIEAIEKRLAG